MSLASTMGNLGAPRIVLGAPKGPKADPTAIYTRGGALPTLKQQRAPSTYAFGSAPGKGGGGGKKQLGAQTPLNPYDAFNLSSPYDPAGIHQTATDAFNTDVSQAKTLSTMGDLTPEQIAAQSKNRADQQTALGSSLAAALAGIKQAYVGQGNASGAALGAQDQAAFAGDVRSAGESGVAPTSAPNLQALLGSQTASGANIYGADEAAALSRGTQGATAAYAAGDTLTQTQNAASQKTLAQLLSSITPVSGRESSMTDANSKVDAANAATHLSIWQNLQNASLAAQASGDRRAIAAAQLAEQRYAAGLSAQTSRGNAALSAQTSTGNAALAAQTSRANALTSAQTSTDNSKRTADTRRQLAIIKAKTTGANKPPTSSGLLSLNRQITKIMGTAGGIRSTSSETSGYTVTLGSAQIRPGVPDSLNKGTSQPIPVDAATGARLKAGDQAAITAFLANYPEQKISAIQPKTKNVTTTKDRPSTWTKWTRALGAVQTMYPQLDRTSAVQIMVKAGYPPPPSPGK